MVLLLFALFVLVEHNVVYWREDGLCTRCLVTSRATKLTIFSYQTQRGYTISENRLSSIIHECDAAPCRHKWYIMREHPHHWISGYVIQGHPIRPHAYIYATVIDTPELAQELRRRCCSDPNFLDSMRAAVEDPTGGSQFFAELAAAAKVFPAPASRPASE